ncbi:L-xylulose 5-phosphate 3-epimerase [Escherichia coli]|uniref:L-xylulose 5-phosphate 3-epimerase n=1 Tax=Escherichia coli TaxID=562 RepID=A0A376X5Z3_ECOLX|nr:L-xylulose 5-phosphate 3-epimerase [Escherichia coli]
MIQLAGYDVYYQEANNETRRRFRDGLKESVEMASRAQVTLAMEIMDYPLMNSISKALGYAHYLNNPWFQLYPDIGNLSAWDNDVQMELQAGIGAYRRGTCERHQTGASSKTCRLAKAWWISNVVSNAQTEWLFAGRT